MNQEKRNNISAILKDVEKFMGKPLISGHTFVGILEKDRLYAIGCFVEKDLRGVMSFRDIEEPTQVGLLSVRYSSWIMVIVKDEW